MKFFIVLFALVAISLTSTEAHSQRRCNFKDFKPISPAVTLLGTWITYQRYDNGPQKNTKCSFYEVVTTGTNLIDWVSNIWEDNSKSCMKGDLTSLSSEKSLIHIEWADTTEMPVSIVSSDHENYLIARACYEQEEYVWVMARTTKPSQAVVKLINAAIIEEGLEEWKLRRSCVGFEDSELVTYT